MVRCMDCAHAREARSARDEPVPGWVGCAKASTPEERARYLAPAYQRNCDAFQPLGR